MEKPDVHFPSDVSIMTTSIPTKQQSVDTVISENLPLTQVLNHIEMEIQQQAGEAGIAGNPVVSHIPISIGTKSDGSASTLCSLSSKEGSENEDGLSSSLFPLNHSSKTSKTEISSSEGLMQDRTETEKIRTIPESSKLPSSKSYVSFADDSMNTVSTSSKSKFASLPSSIITDRPTKKARTISTDVTNSTHLTTDLPPSSPKTTSPPSLQHPPLATLLLAREEDEEHLSPLHVFVRKQIEVFTATPTELAQPAPGRKQPIQLHQVGLRCIHCRNTASMAGRKTRVKRAVCYPSAIGRIYHSVSDMKFDHFGHCKSIPPEVRKTFESLKAEGKSSKEKQSKKDKGKSNKGSSSSSTSKYYRDSAARMGLVDGPGGIIYMSNTQQSLQTSQQNPQGQDTAPTTPPVTTSNVSQQLLSSQSASMPQNFLQQQQQQEEYRKLLLQHQSLATVNTAAVAASMLFPPIPLPTILPATTTTSATNDNLSLGMNQFTTAAMNSSILQSLLMNAVAAGAHAQKSIDAALRAEQQKSVIQQLSVQKNPLKRPLDASSTTTTTSTVGKIVLPLAAPEDANDLNPLHCFVRKHVELFSADKSDTEAPCPGRKTRVTLGQVGIRCKHCAKLNLKPRERVKRAICYPPSIDGIYHSVSNMKFDHFGICPSLPPDAKKELADLKSSYSGRNVGNTNTAKYYRESAVSKGLVDTDKGIRFCQKTGSNPSIVVNNGNATATTPDQQHPAFFQQISAAPLLSIPPTPIPTGISALMMAAATHATSI